MIHLGGHRGTEEISRLFVFFLLSSQGFSVVRSSVSC
jgi:hypothetical protein